MFKPLTNSRGYCAEGEETVMGVPMQTAKTRKKQPSPKMTAASRAAFCFCTKPLRLGGARYLQVHECRELAGRMLAVICGRRGYRQGPPWEDLATSVLQSTAGVAGTVISGTQVDPLPSPLTDRLFLQRCSVDARTCLRTSSSMTRRSSPKHRMRFEGPKRGVPGGVRSVSARGSRERSRWKAG